MANKSKAIGNRYEAEVAHLFSEWWGAPFVRTPASGALRWNNGHWTFADIVPPEDFPGVIECKYNSEIDVDEIFRKKTQDGKITWWWFHQTIPASQRAEQALGRRFIPILAYKVRRGTSRLVLPSKYVEHLRFSSAPLSSIEVTLTGREQFSIFELESFFEHVPRSSFLDTITPLLQPCRQLVSSDSGSNP